MTDVDDLLDEIASVRAELVEMRKSRDRYRRYCRRVATDRDWYRQERDLLAAHRDDYLAVTSAPGFMEAVQAEASAYHRDACSYKQERDRARALAVRLEQELAEATR